MKQQMQTTARAAPPQQIPPKPQNGAAAETAVVIIKTASGQALVGEVSPDSLPRLQLNRAANVADAIEQGERILSGTNAEAEKGLKRGFESVRGPVEDDAEEEPIAARGARA